MAGHHCEGPCGLKPSMYLYLNELILTVCRAAYFNKIYFRNDQGGITMWLGANLYIKEQFF